MLTEEGKREIEYRERKTKVKKTPVICKPQNMEIDQPHTGVSAISGLAFVFCT